MQIATEAPGKSPEEVERFVTIPIELGMTGLPGLVEMRSLNRNGISIVTLVFTDKTSIYFARQLVLERLIEVASRMPDGVTPVLAPPTTGLGEVYQYTLEHPSDRDRPLTEDELQERRTIQDWVVRPMLRSIPGVARSIHRRLRQRVSGISQSRALEALRDYLAGCVCGAGSE